MLQGNPLGRRGKTKNNSTPRLREDSGRRERSGAAGGVAWRRRHDRSKPVQRLTETLGSPITEQMTQDRRGSPRVIILIAAVARQLWNL
jgi:hypothetical protein